MDVGLIEISKNKTFINFDELFQKKSYIVCEKLSITLYGSYLPYRLK